MLDNSSMSWMYKRAQFSVETRRNAAVWYLVIHSIINNCPYINAIKIYLFNMVIILMVIWLILRFYHWLIWILTVRFILFWNYIINERLGSLSNDKNHYYLWSRFWLLMPPFIISIYCSISIFYSAQAIGMSWVKTYK